MNNISSKKIFNSLKSVGNIFNEYGLIFTMKVLFVSIFSHEKYISLIYDKLVKENTRLLNEYTDKKTPSLKEKPNSIYVWCFWWQGYNAAPEIVKFCIDSIYLNFRSKNFKIILLEKNNLNKYCELPDFILSKLNKGDISITHLSDIIRIKLLKKHGGIWIDSTVMVTKPIDPKKFHDFDFFTVKYSKKHRLINGNWTGFLLYSVKGNIMFDFMDEYFMNYWQRHNKLVNYLLIDFGLALFINNNEKAKKDYEEIPYTNPNIFSLTGKLNEKFNSVYFENIVAKNDFIKLSYKDYLNNGVLIKKKGDYLTYYGYMCKLIKEKKK